MTISCLLGDSSRRIVHVSIVAMFAFAVFVRFLWMSFLTKPSIAVDTWCGKAYKQGDPMVIPSGMIKPPDISPVLLLDVSIRPRHNFYLADETLASFVVAAKASHIHGQPYNDPQETPDQQIELRDNANITTGQLQKGDVLAVKIFHTDTGVDIITIAAIAFDETDREYSISLDSFQPRLTPWPITLELRKRDGTKFRATTELSYLPIPRGPQSYSRIDSLRNTLQVRTEGPYWQTIFPYTFYVSGTWLAGSPDNLKKLSSLGYYVLHIVPSGDGIGYHLDQLDAWFDEADAIGMWIMLDMRWTYQNRDYVRTQVERYKRRKNMLLWYTADEPDGHGDPLDAPSKAYAFIKSLDPYHPISLCLNCQNYHFQEYSAGADIILADVYPIGTNTEYSNKYHTPCNTTYGDCGCDNCHTTPSSPALANIPSRLALWSQFQTQLGLPRKTFWTVPQAFTAQDFFTRTPTPKEVVAMALLGMNHGANGAVMWVFPTAEEIVHATSLFSFRATGSEVGQFVLRGKGMEVEVKGEGGAGRVDARAWRDRGEALICAVGLWGEGEGEGEGAKGEVKLVLPWGVSVKAVGRTVWGSREPWRVDGEGGLVRRRMGGTESWLFVVEVEDWD